MARPSAGKSWEFCFEALPKVSRTFALSISKLREPLRSEVCVSYLICRVLDTIEDAPFLDTDERKEIIFPFLERLERRELAGDSFFAGYRQQVGKGASACDYELLTRVDDVLEAFNSLDGKASGAIFPWVDEMGKGMVLYSEKMGSGGIKTIRTLKDLDEYCYYIAGTVGFLLTGLFCLNSEHIDEKLAEGLRKNANDFGLGLQKVNILKDVRDDYKRGWCFIPTELLEKNGLDHADLSDESKSEEVLKALAPMLEGLRDNFDSAFSYLVMMPAEEKDIRLFLATSLFFAGATMSLIAKRSKDYLSEEKLKISRLKVAEILLQLENRAGDNKSLEKFWKKTRSRFDGFLLS